jgi:hypothetical protein
MALSNQSDFPGRFSVPGKSIKKFISIPAYDKPELLASVRLLLAAGFLKSSFEIPACRKPGFGHSR